MKNENQIRPYEVKSLPPGFIVITYNPDAINPWDILIDAEDWKQLKRLGYSGGIAVPEGVSFDSLDEKLMADLGWVRK
jgi:hypothetical protein